MSRIKGKDTRPEMLIRRGLHGRGYRYRVHVRGLPGQPDLVFASRRAVVFVHGCFWHGHGCHLFKWPVTRQEWWQTKIEDSRARDLRNRELLAASGWRQLYIWECALKGRAHRPLETLLDDVEVWLEQGEDFHEIKGSEDGTG